jgi:hypothetical protein
MMASAAGRKQITLAQRRVTPVATRVPPRHQLYFREHPSNIKDY